MQKKDKRNLSTPLNICTAMLIVTCFIGGYGVWRSIRENDQRLEEVNQLAEAVFPASFFEAPGNAAVNKEIAANTEAGKPIPPDYEEALKKQHVEPEDIQFDLMQEKNPDIVGWWKMTGAKVGYPILQGKDNEVYTHTDMNGQESKYGSIFLHSENDSRFTDKNNIIQGNTMRNYSMMSGIKNLESQVGFESGRYMTVYTPEKTWDLEAIAIIMATDYEPYLQTEFATDEEFHQFIDKIMTDSGTAVECNAGDGPLFTLVADSLHKEDEKVLVFLLPEEDVTFHKEAFRTIDKDIEK